MSKCQGPGAEMVWGAQDLERRPERLGAVCGEREGGSGVRKGFIGRAMGSGKAWAF